MFESFFPLSFPVGLFSLLSLTFIHLVRALSQICLLPDRSEKSKRRTKTLALTNDPRWGQTFVYEGLRRADLNNRLFEVSGRTVISFQPCGKRA